MTASWIRVQRRGSLAIALFAAPLMLFVAMVVTGCSASEKEKEPVVTVEAAPAERAAISEVVKAEAVVFPVQQSVITPKITSTIREFKVQRGSRVHKGQLLAVLENADLAAAAEQSKGEFEQAEASYATTVEAGVPQEMQKAELDAAAAKAGYEAAQKVYDSRKDLFQQGALPRRDLDAAQVALAQAKTQSDVAERQLADLKRLGEQHKSTLRPLPPESKLRKRPNPNSRRGWRSSRFKKLSSRAFPLRRNPPRSSRLIRQKKNLARPGTSEVRCWH